MRDGPEHGARRQGGHGPGRPRVDPRDALLDGAELVVSSTTSLSRSSPAGVRARRSRVDRSRRRQPLEYSTWLSTMAMPPVPGSTSPYVRRWRASETQASGPRCGLSLTRAATPEQPGGADARAGDETVFPVLGPAAIGFCPAIERSRERTSSARFDVWQQHGLWLAVGRATRAWMSAWHRPTVVAPHGSLSDYCLPISRRKKRLALRLYERQNLERADCLQATSDGEVEDIRRFGLRSPIARIPNPLPRDPAGGCSRGQAVPREVRTRRRDAHHAVPLSDPPGQGSPHAARRAAPREERRWTGGCSASSGWTNAGTNRR